MAGLRAAYDALMAPLTVFNTPVTLTDFYAMLLTYKPQQDLHVQADDLTSSTNNVVRYNNNQVHNT